MIPQRHRQRVLLINHTDTTRAMRRTLLETAGHRVRETRDGAQAISLLRTSAQPVVVLLELEASTPDSIAVLRAVAQNIALATRHIFILITANAHRLPPLEAAAYLAQVQAMFVPEAPDARQVLGAVAEATRCMVESARGPVVP
jgi:CheY-like chemotaxis protein